MSNIALATKCWNELGKLQKRNKLSKKDKENLDSFISFLESESKIPTDRLKEFKKIFNNYPNIQSDLFSSEAERLFEINDLNTSDYLNSIYYHLCRM